MVQLTAVLDTDAQVARMAECEVERRDVDNTIRHVNQLPDGVDYLISVKGESMRVFLRCHTLESLRALRQCSDSGDLKPVIESWFNHLLAGSTFCPVALKLLSLVDYCKCEDYFAGKCCVDI